MPGRRIVEIEMKLKAFAIMAGLALAAGCATTETYSLEDRNEAVAQAVEQEEDGQTVAVSDADYDPNEMICKTIKRTGTRLGTAKDCRTAKEWRDTMTTANRAINQYKDDVGFIEKSN